MRQLQPLLVALALSPLAPALAAPQGPAQGGPPFVQVPGVGAPYGLHDVAGRLFFASDVAATGNEPWVSAYPDGPSLLLGDLNPGPDDGCHTGDPEALGPADLVAIEFGARVLFSTHAGVGGAGEGDLVNLWISDGTAAGTQHLRTFEKPGGTWNYGYSIDGISLGDRVVFGAYTDSDGWALWGTDGTPQGTVQLLHTAGRPYSFVRFGNDALFAAPTPGNQWMLWRTNGEPQGTFSVAQVLVDASYPARTAVLDGEVYFAGLGVGGRELWKSDGTSAGTVQVADIAPGAAHSDPENLIRVGDFLYFSAEEETFGRELYRSDGTAAGTVRLTDLNVGATHTNLEELTEAGGRLFFHAKVQGKGRVYRYDEAGGLVELGAFEGVSSPQVPQWNAYDHIHDMVALGTRRVLFGARDTSGVGDELWVSDGTPAGTELYADLAPGSPYGGPEEITLANGHVFLRPGNTGSGLPMTLYAAPSGATADPIGQACAASGSLPRLTATDPVLGQATEVSLHDARPQAFALIFYSAPAPPTELGLGCTLYLDLGTLRLLGVKTVEPSGVAALPAVPVPADPAFDGFRVTLQAAVGPTATQPLGFDLSNAVLLTLGQ